MESRWTIYCHVHIASGRRYVGLTKLTMMRRWNQHVYRAFGRKLGGKSHFWAAIFKYGKDAFSHEILETCSSLEEANVAEEKWIAHFGSMDPGKGFNLAPGGKFRKPKARTNPWDDPEYREKMTKSCQEVVLRPGVRKKIGEAARGRAMSEETRALISENLRNREPRTQEVRDRIRAALKARDWSTKPPMSSETRRKISAAVTGRVTSEETKAKISASGKARHAGVVRTHCKRGHDLAENNVYMNPRGVRECRTCNGRRSPSSLDA